MPKKPPPPALCMGPAASPETWRGLLAKKVVRTRRGERSTPRLHRELGHLLREASEGMVDLNALSIDGHSLIAHALSGKALWAVAPLLRAGLRPRQGEPFLTEILTVLPGQWRLAWPARAGLSERNEAGETPLHRAVIAVKSSAVAALLHAGAAPSARDRQDKTPLHCVWETVNAGRGEASEAAARLLSAGARWDATDAAGNTPFHCLLKTFPKRPGPPDLDMRTAVSSANAMDGAGIRPLSIVLRASLADLLDLNPFKGTPASPVAWVTWLRAHGAVSSAANDDGTTPQDDFAAWREAAERARSSSLAAMLPLWAAMEMEAVLPSPAQSASRIRL